MGVAQSALDPCIKCFKFTPPPEDQVAYQPVNQSNNQSANNQSNNQATHDDDNWDDEFDDFLDDDTPLPSSKPSNNQSSNQSNNQSNNQPNKHLDEEIVDERSLNFQSNNQSPRPSPTNTQSIKTMNLTKLPPPPAARTSNQSTNQSNNQSTNQPVPAKPVDLFDSLGMSTKYTEPVRVPKKPATNQSNNQPNNQPAVDVSKYLDDDEVDLSGAGWGDELDLIEETKAKKKKGLGAVMSIED